MVLQQPRLQPGGQRLWGLGWKRDETLKCSAEVLHELLEHVSGTALTLWLENSWHYEDTVHDAESTGFYRINAELQN